MRANRAEGKEGHLLNTITSIYSLIYLLSRACEFSSVNEQAAFFHTRREVVPIHIQRNKFHVFS
jgi:hypothetical protein